MVGKTNVGSSGKLFAVIAVTYPEGSVCTCSNGTKTLKARDTSGKALFNVTVGEWTVTATDGDKTKSVTVDITTVGQIESVKLSYKMWLYNKGDQCVDVTGGYTDILNQGIAFMADHIVFSASNSSGAIRTKQSININSFSRLGVSINNFNNADWIYFAFGGSDVQAGSVHGTIYAEYEIEKKAGIQMFDIPDTLPSEVYCSMGAYKMSFHVDEIWIE